MIFPLYVVVATAGRDSLLHHTLCSLNNCAKPLNFKGVIVVENGSKNDVEKIVLAEELSNLQIQYLYSPIPSKSNALNIAIRILGEEDALIFFTDDDVLFGDEVLESYSSVGSRYGHGHFFGGPLERTPESALPANWMIPLLPLSVLGWEPRESLATTFFLGCNWAAFRSDIEALKGFNMQFGPGSVYGAVGQETNMQTRLIADGCISVYVEKAIVAHRVSLETMSIRWILNRQMKAGIYIGLSTIDCAVRYDRSCAGNRKPLVIDSTVKLSGADRIKFTILKTMAICARAVGQLKGTLVRLYLEGGEPSRATSKIGF